MENQTQATNQIYLDNAASAPILKEVVEVMSDSMLNFHGNPSAIHQAGRKSKSIIEKARKNIAKHFNAQASEIIFNSGGTEGDSQILINAVENLGVTKIISSKIEHHAVLNTLLHLKKKHEFLDLEWVVVDEDGGIDYDHLATLLANTESKTLVSLMTVNNEIGNMLDLEKVSKLCKDYHAYFHTDAVQAVGHFNIDVEKTPIDFLVASSHKFHGPRGVGFVYIKKGIPVDPILFGGSQEKGVRPGTENVAGIIGMEKALEISMNSLEDHAFKVLELKKHLIGELNVLGDFKFNGKSGSLEESSYTILSVRFPVENSLLLFELDLKGIAASGGSACQSGSTKGSHVLGEILSPEEASKTSIRFSLSKLNTKDEIDHLVKIIAQVLKK